MQSFNETLHLNLKSYFNRIELSLKGLGLVDKATLQQIRNKPQLQQYYSFLELRDKAQQILLGKNLARPESTFKEISHFCHRFKVKYEDFALTESTEPQLLYRNLIRLLLKYSMNGISLSAIQKKNISIITSSTDVKTMKYIIQLLSSGSIPSKLQSRLKQIIAYSNKHHQEIYQDAITELRNAVADTEKRRNFIRTVHKYGFNNCLKCNQSRKLTFDHVIARVNLKAFSIANYHGDCELNGQWLCTECNSLKGSENTDYRKIDHFMAVVKSYSIDIHDILNKEFMKPQIAAFVLVKGLFYGESQGKILEDIQEYTKLKSKSSVRYYFRKLQDILKANNLVLK